MCELGCGSRSNAEACPKDVNAGSPIAGHLSLVWMTSEIECHSLINITAIQAPNPGPLMLHLPRSHNWTAISAEDQLQREALQCQC